MLQGWSAIDNQYPAVLIMSSSLDILESRKVSDKHTISKLLVVMYASINGSLIKPWASAFKFQWKNFKQGG